MERTLPTERTRSNSRSPRRSSPHSPLKRTRSHSPPGHRAKKRHRGDGKHAHGREPKSSHPEPAVLPLKAKRLSKHDLKAYYPLFGSYLDIQKELAIDELSEDELKGRWKSFMNKWNRGELAEGWYDPATKAKAAAAVESWSDKERRTGNINGSGNEMGDISRRDPESPEGKKDDDEDDDDDLYGPVAPPPSDLQLTQRTITGPSAPNFSDLSYRDELSAAEAADARTTLRHDRKLDRRAQKEQLEELAPRAEPGTKERQMEKKREAAAANKAYREASGAGGAVEEVGEAQLMGEGGMDEVKKMKEQAQRKKNEREIRKEEMLRARAAEREERLAEHRKKEDETLTMLKALAKENFG